MPESPNRNVHRASNEDFDREVTILVPKAFVVRVTEVRLREGSIGSIILETDAGSADSELSGQRLNVHSGVVHKPCDTEWEKDLY